MEKKAKRISLSKARPRQGNSKKYEKSREEKDFFVSENENSYGKPYSVFYENPEGATKLLKGDCIEILSRAEENSVDMIFADPPYFLSNGGISCHGGKMVSVNKGKWDKSKGALENHKFSVEWLKACQRVLKPDGTIWVSGTTHIIYSIGFAMQELGYKILNDIVWYKRNAPPNLSCRYFTHSTEMVLWAAKNSKSRHYFDYPLMKKINNNKQMRNVWIMSPPSAQEKKFGKHPTQKPVELLERIILASTRKGDLVLDPFCGSSTTGVAALSLNRRYVGIDMEDDYLNLSVKRLTHPLARRSVESMQLQFAEVTS